MEEVENDHMNERESLVAEPFCASCGDTRIDCEACGYGMDEALALRPSEEGETLDAFLARLERIATDWRYSDEFIGLIVRSRWPSNRDVDSDKERRTD